MHAGLWAIQRLKVSYRTVPYVRSAHDVLMMVERLSECSVREQAEEVMRDFGIDTAAENIFPIGWIGYSAEDISNNEVHTLADSTGTIRIVVGKSMLNKLHSDLVRTVRQWLDMLAPTSSIISSREIAEVLAASMVSIHKEG